jgi:hypothetical protein
MLGEMHGFMYLEISGAFIPGSPRDRELPGDMEVGMEAGRDTVSSYREREWRVSPPHMAVQVGKGYRKDMVRNQLLPVCTTKSRLRSSTR